LGTTSGTLKVERLERQIIKRIGSKEIKGSEQDSQNQEVGEP
jgi:hypothetical protein